ncbi:MAG: hypothetical protein CFE45_22280, partial [Burkholderiales bacterium PBB5]
MLDLTDSLRGLSADILHQPGTARPALRARGYAGPERRSAASQQHRRMAQMLDAIDYGMLLMADHQRIAHANKAARRDLDASHPLVLVGDELHTRREADAAPLREAMIGAAQRGLRRLLQLGERDTGVSVAVV